MFLWASLQASAQDEASEGLLPPIALYGFADFNIAMPLIGPDNAWAAKFPYRSSFQVGHLNLYVDSQVGKRWRSLAEVRFTYAPRGKVELGESSDQQILVDNSAPDYADWQRSLEWGGVSIERAYLQYHAGQLLEVKFGAWLTPYGIWNVDHGSPVIIGVQQPYIIGQELFPSKQTGIQLSGEAYAGDAELGYQLTLSNGRGPIDSFGDLDGNKGVGTRLYLNEHALGAGTLGVSAYYGRYTNLTTRTTDAYLPRGWSYSENLIDQYDELALAADAQLELNGWHLQAEFVSNQLNYTPEGRRVFVGGQYLQDLIRYGAYGLVGYRIPAIRTMPYAYYEQNFESDLGKTYRLLYVGLNFRPDDRVVFKLQYLNDVLSDSKPVFSTIEGQIAWAF